MDAIDLLRKNVASLCEERHLNQKMLAEKAGLPEATVSRALYGNPQLKTVERIAKALDVSIKSLFENPDDIEGFILLRGKSYHFNNTQELTAIEMKQKTVLSVRL